MGKKSPNVNTIAALGNTHKGICHYYTKIKETTSRKTLYDNETGTASRLSSVSCVRLRTHLSLVLRLQSQPSLDAAPRLQEGLTLSPVRQVTDEDAGGVHAHEQHSLSSYLEHRRTDGRMDGEIFEELFSVFGTFHIHVAHSQ